MVKIVLQRALFLTLLAASAVGVGSVVTSARATDSTPLRRTLLAPWSSQESEHLVFALTLSGVEMALNYYGYTVDYIDLDREALPDPESAAFRARYAGVITCFTTENLKQGRKLATFLRGLSRTGTPWVALGQLGILEAAPEAELRELFAALGVKLNATSRLGFGGRVESKKAGAFGFERPVPATPRSIPPLELAASPGAPGESWLRLRTGDGKVSDAAFVSPKMSLAYDEFGLWVDLLEAGRRQWVIDPFQFLPAALGLDLGAPVPDVAVLNGARVFYSHIDGDSFESISRVRDASGNTRTCAEVTEAEIINAYPSLPFGISVIVASLLERQAPDAPFSDKLVEIARRILQLPNVEAASHTYSHPFNWGKQQVAFDKAIRRFDASKETAGSLEWINRTLKPARKAEVLYWSGNCVPGEDSLAALSTAGFLNMNGGDSKFDSRNPSVATLAPLGRPVGRQFQVYSANANENVYTNDWTGPYDGFKQVVETFVNSAKDRILKPINIYYHFYSVEREAALQALKQVYAWSDAQDIAPVLPAFYVRSVLGFRSAKLARIAGSEGSYEISGARGLRTLRVERPQGRVVDLARSIGVLGFETIRGRLYIHLDPAADRARVALAREGARLPHLVHAGGAVEGGAKGRAGIGPRLRLAEFTRGPIRIAGLPAGARKLSVTVTGDRPVEVAVRDGQASIPVAGSPRERELQWKIVK